MGDCKIGAGVRGPASRPLIWLLVRSYAPRRDGSRRLGSFPNLPRDCPGRGLLSSCAVEVLEAAIKSCDGVWHVWTIGDVGAGATLVAAAVGPQKTNAGGKPGAAGLVPTPGTLVTPARLAMAEGYSTPDVVADAARRRAWLQVFGQRARPAGALIRVRDVPWLAGRWRPFDVETMDETGAEGASSCA